MKEVVWEKCDYCENKSCEKCSDCGCSICNKHLKILGKLNNNNVIDEMLVCPACQLERIRNKVKVL